MDLGDAERGEAGGVKRADLVEVRAPMAVALELGTSGGDRPEKLGCGQAMQLGGVQGR